LSEKNITLSRILQYPQTSIYSIHDVGKPEVGLTLVISNSMFKKQVSTIKLIKTKAKNK